MPAARSCFWDTSATLLRSALNEPLRQEDEPRHLQPFGDDVADNLAPLALWIHLQVHDQPTNARDGEKNLAQSPLRTQRKLRISYPREATAALSMRLARIPAIKFAQSDLCFSSRLVDTGGFHGLRHRQEFHKSSTRILGVA